MKKITTMTAAAIGLACLALTGCVDGGSYNSYDRGYYQSYGRPNYSDRRGRDWNRGRNDGDRNWNRDGDRPRGDRNMSRPDNARHATARGPQGRFEMRNGRRIWIPNRE